MMRLISVGSDSCCQGPAVGLGPARLRTSAHAAAVPPNDAVDAVDDRLDEEETIRFRDVSDTSGIDFVHHSGDSPEKNFPNTLGSGIALLDYDGDGWLDVYFATTRMLPLEAPDCSRGNRLYRNRGDCTFEDVTERAGVGFRGFTHGVVAGDLDGNGFPDLFLTNLGPNVLYLNRGDGTFRDASRGAGVEGAGWSTGSAMFDYDSDGDLDLYVSSYGRWTYGGERPFFGNLRTRERVYCPPTTINPERHFLLRNRGDATFEDVTEAAGILRRDGRGLGVVAADLNGDGLTDLYVANDMSPNFLFLNRGDGTFEDLTETSGAARNAVGKTQASMGVDAEDLTGDGLPELVVTNFREEYTTIYRNLDGRNFQDISGWAGVVPESRTGVGWGCALADLDNDGWPDLVVVNGHVDNNLPFGGGVLPQAEPPKVWRNLGEGRFRAVRDAGPFFTSRPCRTRRRVRRPGQRWRHRRGRQPDGSASGGPPERVSGPPLDPPGAADRGPRATRRWRGRRGARGRSRHPPPGQGRGQLPLVPGPQALDRPRLRLPRRSCRSPLARRGALDPDQSLVAADPPGRRAGAPRWCRAGRMSDFASRVS